MKKLGHKLHIYISAFFLPVALMYAITGVLYIFGIDEDIGAITNKYTIDMTPNENKIDILTDYLKNNNIKIPSDTTPKNTKNGGISIGGIYYSARINEVDNKYEITTIQRSIYGAMVLLHKSKGGYRCDTRLKKTMIRVRSLRIPWCAPPWGWRRSPPACPARR